MLASFIVFAVLSSQLELSGAFTMGTHNNPAFPTSIETHRTITKCALDRSAHAFLRAKNPDLDEPAECGTDGIWSDLVRATNRLSIGISEYKKVRDLIWQSSVDVDAKYDAVSRYHFDGETLETGNDMVMTNTRTSRDLLRVGQLTESRKLIGEMLHTVQDFYSHSNWIELGNTAPLDTLGVARDLGTLASSDEPTCMRCAFDEVGYCYDNIDEDILVNKKLMSGYYTKQDSVKPPGVLKCSHGGYLDSGDSDGGINKDAVNEPDKLQLSPHGYLHFEAANLAAESSVRYLANFWDMVGYENYGKFLAFDQRTSTIVITIDTTGSMAEEINACVQAATQLALTFSDSATQPTYVLSPFNDPDYGPATYYENVTLFVDDVEKLYASDGGDEPELCMTGILLGANAVRQPGGMMFVFTDASAKDAELEADVISLLKEKQLIVNFVITATIDLTQYKRIASATGGQVLMVLDQSKIVEVTLSLFNATFVNLIADPTAEMVEMMYAKSETVVSSTPTYDVDADSSLKQVSVVVATDSAVFPTINITAERVVKHTSQLFRSEPEAREAVPIDYTVVYSDATKSIVEVRSVPSATLQIRSTFSGLSRFSMSVTAAATFNVALRFMRETPIGFSPVLSGEPLVGQPLWAYVEVESADYVVQQLVLLDENSTTIMTLEAVSLASDPLSFAAQFTVPSQSFRVRVEGTNKATGDSFERLIRSQFTASAAYLKLLETESSFVLYPSTTKQVQLSLTNVATTRTYALSVAGTADFLTRSITPTSVTLSSNQTVVANVSIVVPASNAIGLVDTITVVAKATVGGTDTNSLIITAVVADPERDVTAPVLTVEHTDSQLCGTTTASLCDTVNWTATVVAQDDGGLRQFYVRDATSSNLADLGVTVAYSPALTIGTTESITADMVTTCCVGYLVFVAVDLEGNSRQVSFTATVAADPTTTSFVSTQEATVAADPTTTSFVSTQEAATAADPSTASTASTNDASTKFATVPISVVTTKATSMDTTELLSTSTSKDTTDVAADIKTSTTNTNTTATTTTTTTTSHAGLVSSSAPPTQYVILIVDSVLTVDAIEAQIEAQFGTLFAEYCAGPSADATCSEYWTSSLRSRTKFNSNSNPTTNGCTYDVSIFNYTAQSNRKTLYTAVYYVCSGAASPMPSLLLASFFNATSNRYDQMTILAVLASTELAPPSASPTATASQVSTSSANVPVQTSIYYVYLDNETYLIVIICLSVVAFLLMATVGGVLMFYNFKPSNKKHRDSRSPCCKTAKVSQTQRENVATENGTSISMQVRSDQLDSGTPTYDYDYA